MTDGSRTRAVALAASLLARPDLWWEAVVTTVRLAPAGWWRRWPPDPRPDPSYWRFRIETAYGGTGDASPKPHDVVEFLEWRRARRRRSARPLR